MNRTLAMALLAFLLLLQGPPTCARTITVGQTAVFDHTTIQAAIDAASEGETIVVSTGTYVENIHFRGRNIVLQSTNPTSPPVVAATVIDGYLGGSVVRFAGTETRKCVLSGFTLFGGHGSPTDPGGGWQYGGGIFGNGCHATIQNNTISDNFANLGGGLAYCHGTIQNNTIVGNETGNGSSASGGGGLYMCDGLIQNNRITDNVSYGRGGGYGAGLFLCNGTIQGNLISSNTIYAGGILGGGGGGFMRCGGVIRNNTIARNSAPGARGGGLSECGGIIQNNRIIENTASGGGGLNGCDGQVLNNIISGNSANWSSSDPFAHGGGLWGCDGLIANNAIVANNASSGGGLSECYGTILNNTIWSNTATTDPQIHQSSIPAYCSIEDWTGAGVGNMDDNPRFLDPDGPDNDPNTFADNDYHLSSNSPCIDRGHPAAEWNDACLPPGLRTVRNDMGAYGGPHNDGWLTPPPADLAGTLSDVSPYAVEAGQAIYFSGSVTNLGGQAIAGKVWVEFLAVHPQTGRRDFICDSILVGPLGAGESFDLASIAPVRIVYGGLAPGVYTVELKIDPTQLVSEWMETNNTAQWGLLYVSIAPPNLVVEDFDFSPQDVVADGGTMMAFSGKVQNTGTTATARGFWIEFRLWPDLPFRSTGPYLCGSYFVGQTLSSGESLDLDALPARPTRWRRAYMWWAALWTRATKSPSRTKPTTSRGFRTNASTSARAPAPPEGGKCIADFRRADGFGLRAVVCV